MVLRLAERLDVPLRDRNTLLLAAGYAPSYPVRSFDDPALKSIRQTLQSLLSAQEPYPALAVDRHWNLVASNRALAPLIAGVTPELLVQPVNVLRLSLHPRGLASRIQNWEEWRGHVLHRLQRQRNRTADPVLTELLSELASYSKGVTSTAGEKVFGNAPAIAIPLLLESDAGVLSLLSTTMVFGTPRDVTLSELAIETFLPADPFTLKLLYQLLPL